MTQCIKCGRNISDGELFCTECSKLPVIASLNSSSSSRTTVKPDTRKRAVATKPQTKQTQKKKARSALTVPFVIVCVLLVGTLSLLLWQQSKLHKEKNSLRTQEERNNAQMSALKGRLQILSDIEDQLEEANLLIEEKELEIQALSEQLASSQSTQNQGEYDMSQLQKDLDDLQIQLDTITAERDQLQADYDTQALALAASQEQADFLYQYAVFVHTNTTDKLYHRYGCEDFTEKSFVTYSPRLAEKYGYSACPKCKE